MDNSEHVLDAAKKFGISPVGVKVLTEGLMHKTYKIETAGESYILQQMHPLLSSDAVVHDFMHVTEHLRSHSFYAPVCLRTSDGSITYRDGDHIFRMCTFIPSYTISVIKDVRSVTQAGILVARFHEVMADFPYPFESSLVLHQTREIHAGLKEVFATHEGSPLMTPEVKELGGMILETLPTLYLPEDLPKRPAHGDLKISNILFDEVGTGVSIIDFDTCNRMMLPVEMGDAFRSWCGQEEDKADNTFNMEWFQAGWEGYISSARKFIEPQERKHIVQGILLITLELAARFLKDYFDDSYFGWDETRYATRREQNLARAKGQMALYLDLLSKRDKAEEIVQVA